MRSVKGLYGVTIDNNPQTGQVAEIAEIAVIESQVRAALEGGASVIQFRDKHHTLGREKIAENLARLCRLYDAIYIINDDLDLALAVDADGVHLGKDDLDIKSARKKIGNKIIGVSCYNKLELAIEAEELGADYVAFGRFFSSLTKPEAVLAEIDLLHAAKKQISLPIVAIGGITIDNAAQLIKAGASSIAVVNDLFNQQNVEKRAREFSNLFK